MQCPWAVYKEARTIEPLRLESLKSIRIKAKLQTRKVATTDLFLPLDSMLAWAWMQENHPDRMEAFESSINPEGYVTEELPLERRGHGEDWYWACSFACGQPKGEEILHSHRRFDADLAEDYWDFGNRSGRVNTALSPFKNKRMPVVTYLVPELSWYAVGDVREIERLLTWITHVGCHRGQGFGRVASWTVEACDEEIGEEASSGEDTCREDLSCLRAIPCLPGQGGTLQGIRPPYWLSWQWRLARVPDDPRLACRAAKAPTDDAKVFEKAGFGR